MTLAAIFMIGFGLALAIHCPRAAWREFHAGIGRGMLGNYPRSTMPVRFWTTVLMTGAGGVIGAVFFAFGLTGLIIR